MTIQAPALVEGSANQLQASKEMMEIQALFVIAQQCKRNRVECREVILQACEDLGLAEESSYAYNRGGTDITGPSVKLIEEIACIWGRIKSGWRVLNATALTDKFSTVYCYALDMETLNLADITITVPHSYTAYGKLKELSSPEDVYYHVANQASRRKRVCMEKCLPKGVVNDALAQCEATMKNASKRPIDERRVLLVEWFQSVYGVTKKQIERRMQRSTESLTESNLVVLRGIGNSLRDGMSRAEDWFGPPETDAEIQDVTAKKPEQKEESKPKGRKNKVKNASEHSDDDKTVSQHGGTLIVSPDVKFTDERQAPEINDVTEAESNEGENTEQNLSFHFE